jgi:hypothetical protein
MRFGSQYGTWQLDNLPGCDQICVSHSAFVLNEKKAQGFGDAYHKQRLAQMRNLLYDGAVATVRDGNIAQEKIMTTNGWNKVFTFLSKKTQNTVSLWVKQL